MDTPNDHKMNETFQKVYDEQRQTLIDEYSRLCLQKTMMTDAQTARILAILEKATDDPVLSFLVEEADHRNNHELGLVDAEVVERAQKSLKRNLGQHWLDIEDSSIVLKNAQSQLKSCGYYAAKIDGIPGEKTSRAFHKLSQTFRWSLQKEGLYPETHNDIASFNVSDAIKIVKERCLEGELSQTADLLSIGLQFSLC